MSVFPNTVDTQWPAAMTPGMIPLSTRQQWLEETGITRTSLTTLLTNHLNKRNPPAPPPVAAGPSKDQIPVIPVTTALPSPVTTVKRMSSTPFELNAEEYAMAKFKAKEDICMCHHV
jgi:hypothetical protein